MPSNHKSYLDNVNTNLLDYLISMPFSKRQTLDSLLYRGNLFEVIYPAQTTIAKEVGCTRRTVSRNVSDLEEVNLIQKITRPWNTCIYKINPMLNDPDLRWRLRAYFKSFKVRPLLPLLFIPFVTIDNIEKEKSFHNHMSHHISSSFPSSSLNSYSLSLNSYIKEEERTSSNNVTSGLLVHNARMLHLSDKLFKKGKSIMSENTIVSPFVDNVCKVMNFNSEQRLKLAIYPDKIVNMAFELSKGKKFNDKFHNWNFINAIVRKEFAKQTTSPSDYTGLASDSSNKPTEENKRKAWKADRSFFDKDTVINIATELQKLQQLMLQPNIFAGADYGRRIIQNVLQKEMIFTREEGEDVALFYINSVRNNQPVNTVEEKVVIKAKATQTEDNVKVLRDFIAKYLPNSNTTNDNTVAQPNTQASKKDSTASNVVDVNSFEPSYNPDDEEEDLNDPILL